jgi:hypothetical protein
MLYAGIQGVLSTNCRPGFAGSKFATSQHAIRSGGAVKAAETQRIRLWLWLGRSSTTTIPATGMKVM